MNHNKGIYRPQFQCFIRKNTPELRAKLIVLNVLPLYGMEEWMNGEWLWVGDMRFTNFCEDEVDLDEKMSDYGIDCGTDEKMFLELATREPNILTTTNDQWLNWMTLKGKPTSVILDKFIGVEGTPERKLFNERVKVIDQYFNTHDDIIGAIIKAGLVPPEHKPLELEGFVARDKCGSLTFYNKMPYRFRGMQWLGSLFDKECPLPSESFPDIQWEDEPLPVTLTITPKC